MRRYLVILAAVLASASFLGALGATTPAAAQNNPVCRFSGGDEQGSLRCDFANFDQCRASTAGTGGSCVANPEATSTSNANANASYRGRARRIH
jgi:hypothetical protein